MTEIPEHLLKRSKAARAQAEGGAPAGRRRRGCPRRPAAAAATTASTSPAVPTPAAPPAAPAGPPPPKPDIPVVAAAKARKKIPFWAFATLSTLPLWAFMYVRALTPSADAIAGPLGDGATVYTGCSSCHGSRRRGWRRLPVLAGRGAQDVPAHRGPAALGRTPAPRRTSRPGVEIYGDPNRAGGAHIAKAKGVMPAQAGQLTEAQILAVVCHERFTLGRRRPDRCRTTTEFDKWCAEDSPAWTALEDGSVTFDNIDTKVPGAIKVGTEPAPGSSAGT